MRGRRHLAAGAAIVAALAGCGGGDDGPASPSHDSAEGAMAGLLAATRSGNNAQLQSWLAPPPRADRRSISGTLRMRTSLGLGGDLFWKTDTLKIKGTKRRGDDRVDVRLSGPIVWCLGLGPSDPKASCAQPNGSRGQAPVYPAVKVHGRWYVDLDVNMGRDLPGPGGSPSEATARRLKNRLGALGETFNAGDRRFVEQATADAKDENLAAIKADASQFRDVIFEYDSEFRKIQFPPAFDDEVNAVLNANGTAIAQLDAMDDADKPSELLRLLERFQAQKKRLIAAANALAQRL